MKRDYLLELMRSPKTVFTFKDIALLWGQPNFDFVKKKVHRLVKAGKLHAIRRGIYSKDENYNKFELATKIYTPSYISFETVLSRHGVIFQHYGEIFIASYLSRSIEIDSQTYVFRKIKRKALTNHLGVEKKENYWIASKERAFLDMVYLFKDYHFDNLSSLDWEKIFGILPIYENKTMIKRVNSYKNAGS